MKTCSLGNKFSYKYLLHKSFIGRGGQWPRPAPTHFWHRLGLASRIWLVAGRALNFKWQLVYGACKVNNINYKTSKLCFSLSFLRQVFSSESSNLIKFYQGSQIGTLQSNIKVIHTQHAYMVIIMSPRKK